MEHKLHNFVLQPDGKIGWIENMPAYSDYAPRRDRHEQALQSAISNAIPVVNQGEVRRTLEMILRNEWIETGKVYPLQCHVEKKEFCEDFDKEGRPFDCPFNGSERHKTVALVTFPSSAGVEETQEELIFKLKEYDYEFGDWYGLPGTSYIKLTRKNK